MSIIHNLVARFRADTGAFDRNINKSRSNMTRFGRDVQRMGRQLLAVAGVGGGIYAVKRAFESVTKAALAQEKAERDLMAATGTSITGFKQYAAEMQKLTTYGDEQILTQMAYARNLGVTNDKLKEATKAALGLAARFRIDLASAMMLVGRASQGQTQLLTRYGIVIDQTLSDQEKFNRLLEIGADSFGLAEAEAATAAGSIQQVKNAISDVAETIGNTMLPTIQRLSRETTTFLQDNSYKIRRYIDDYIQGLMLFEKYMNPLRRLGIYKPKEEPAKKTQPVYMLPAEAKSPMQTAMDKSIAIHKKYQSMLETERSLIGLTSDERERAATILKYENELKAAGVNDPEWLNRYTDAMRKQLIELEKQKKAEQDRQEAVKNTKRIYTDIARGIAGEWSSAFDQMLFESKKFADALKDVFRGIFRMVTQIIMYEKLAKPIAAGIMGIDASTLHSGGVVGRAGGRRKVPAMAFANAPRFHNGFFPGEYPAILKRNETVVPAGGGGMPQIVINNNTGSQFRQEGQPIFDGKKLIIKVVADDLQSGGPLRKMIGNMR